MSELVRLVRIVEERVCRILRVREVAAPQRNVHRIGEIRHVRIRVAALTSFDEQELVRHRQTCSADQQHAPDPERARQVPSERPVDEDLAVEKDFGGSKDW